MPFLIGVAADYLRPRCGGVGGAVRLACPVVPAMTRPVASRPYSDGSGREGAHAPHYLVVEAVSQVWEEVLRELGDDVLPWMS